MRSDEDDPPPSWAGAPGYTPHPELPAHSPMPGAPPYPANIDHPPPPVNEAPARTGLLLVLGATVAWAFADLLLVLLVLGLPSGSTAAQLAAGLAVTVLLSTVAVWLLVRRRAWGFGLVLLATAPVFWILRAIVTALLG